MSTPPTILRLGAVSVDLDRREFVRDGKCSGLTATEVALLAYLAARPGIAVSREELLEHVWGWRPDLQTRAVFHAVTRLRKKLEVDASEPRWLRAAYGVGYVLDLRPERDPTGPALLGRSAELATLDALEAGGARRVTLTGPAGVGKTTLASSWAASRSPVVVELTAVAPEHFASTVAAALGAAPGGDPDDAIVRALASAPRLLVLDGFEPLAATCAARLGAWLARAPDATVLVTSREPLGVPDEHLLRIEPLAVPDEGIPDDALRANDAVTLLSAVAARVRAGAGLSPEERVDAAAVVRALDGLPLAIELAGARLQAMSIRDLRDRLAGRLDWTSADGRHGTLRTAIGGSWELLSGAEREALARCSVFRGGFDLGQAEIVLGAGAQTAIEALVSRSLLVAQPGFGMRYRLLDAIRDFAGEQLAALGVDPTALARAHASCFAALGSAEAEEALAGARSRETLDRLCLARHNLAAAAEWALRHEELELARGCVVGYHHIAFHRGPYAPAVSLLEQLRAVDPSPRVRLALGRALEWVGDDRAEGNLREAAGDPECRAVALTELGFLLVRKGRLADAEGTLLEALPLVQRRPFREAAVQHHLARVFRMTGRIEEARRALRRALQLVSGPEPHRLEGTLRVQLGQLLILEGRLDRASTDLDAARALLRADGDWRGEAFAASQQAIVAMLTGRWQEAEAHIRVQLAAQQRLGARGLEAIARTNLGICAAEQGRLAEAEEAFETALSIQRDVGDRRGEVHTLVNLGCVLLDAGVRIRSLRVLEQAVALARELGVGRLLGLALANLASVSLSSDLAAASAQIQEAEPLVRAAGDVAQLGILACTKGRIALRRGLRDEAGAAHAEATAIAVQLGASDEAPLRRALAELTAEL